MWALVQGSFPQCSISNRPIQNKSVNIVHSTVDMFFCDTSGHSWSSSQSVQNVWACFQGSFHPFKIWFLTESPVINCDVTLADCNNCHADEPKHAHTHTHTLHKRIYGLCYVFERVFCWGYLRVFTHQVLHLLTNSFSSHTVPTGDITLSLCMRVSECVLYVIKVQAKSQFVIFYCSQTHVKVI